MLRLILLAVVALAACGKPTKQANECDLDTDCPLGQVCQELGKVCITATCDFCTEDQVCYKPTPDSEGSCSAPPDCEAGECEAPPDMGMPDANVESVCASLDREVVAFGPVPLGTIATEVVRVENCSEAATLTVEGASIGPFSAPGIEVAAGESGDFELTFGPTEAGSFTSDLLLVTNAGDFRVTATGSGVEPEVLCPIPIIEAGAEGMLDRSERQVHMPGTIVTLSAASSEAPGGEIAEYEWTVVERPATSTSMLSTPTESNTTLELDVLGNYTVELNVTDSVGTSCMPARVTFVSADAAIPRFRIVLTWSTPTDGDESDTSGTDMDLHYLNPTGSWNQAPGDIYWLNPTADWPGEDPELTIDDTDGAGPEEIIHNAPRTDEVFRIGAYYYADNGFGPSYATLQVFVDGVLAHEYRDMYLASAGTFWGITLLNGLDGAVNADTVLVQQGFPLPP